MTSFLDSLKAADPLATCRAAQNVNIQLGDGNNIVEMVADDSSISAGDGNNEIYSLGDDDSILVGEGNNKIETAGLNTQIIAGDISNPDSKGKNNIYQTGDNAKILVSNGDNTIISYSNNAVILGGDGNNTVGQMGNNVKFGFGDGNNHIGFWGDNAIMDLGNGNNNVKTLDFLVGGPSPEDDKSAQLMAQQNFALNAGQTLGRLAENADIMEMANLVKSTYKAGEETSKVITGTTTQTTTSGNTRRTTTTTHYLTTYYNYLEVNGVKNPTIKFGNGNNDIGLTVTDANYSVSSKTSEDGNNNIKVNVGGYKYYTTAREETSSTSVTTTTRINTADPIIIDFNQDGKVSAQAGKGIDLNGDGKADGAATNGDKMLAMSDINGNGTIDGTEVFGDDTVDPFTGKKLNAANGFEALAQLASSATKHTGIICMDVDGNVNLQSLKRALATVGINLGFVSDANNTKLEELEKVVTINTSNYKNSTEESNGALHAQQGTYTDENGNTYKAHDVWFNK